MSIDILRRLIARFSSGGAGPLQGAHSPSKKRKHGPRRPAGTKIRRKAQEGKLGVSHPLGLAGEAVLNMAAHKNAVRLQERRRKHEKEFRTCAGYTEELRDED